MYNSSSKPNTNTLALTIGLIYGLGIIAKKIIIFNDGVIDLILIAMILSFLSIDASFKQVELRKVKADVLTLLFMVLIIYIFILSLVNSHNTMDVNFIETISIFKWYIYFYMGRLVAKKYDTRGWGENNFKTFFVLSLFAMIYSVITYNWSGVNGRINDLFGFYYNSYESIFSLRSVFSLYAFAIFILAVNAIKRTNYSIILIGMSLLFMFMSGNRKILIAVMVVLIFINYPIRYKIVIRLLVLFAIILALALFAKSEFVQFSIIEYSNPNQPRLLTYLTAIKIFFDYLPFGSGAGTFASLGSIVNYSPLYREYGLDYSWGFGADDEVSFINDTYWAQIIGQYGLIGCCIILLMLARIYRTLKDRISLISGRLQVAIILYLSMSTPALSRTEVCLILILPLGIRFQESINYRNEKP